MKRFPGCSRSKISPASELDKNIIFQNNTNANGNSELVPMERLPNLLKMKQDMNRVERRIKKEQMRSMPKETDIRITDKPIFNPKPNFIQILNEMMRRFRNASFWKRSPSDFNSSEALLNKNNIALDSCESAPVPCYPSKKNELGDILYAIDAYVLDMRRDNLFNAHKIPSQKSAVKRFQYFRPRFSKQRRLLKSIADKTMFENLDSAHISGEIHNESPSTSQNRNHKSSNEERKAEKAEEINPIIKYQELLRKISKTDKQLFNPSLILPPVIPTFHTSTPSTAPKRNDPKSQEEQNNSEQLKAKQRLHVHFYETSQSNEIKMTKSSSISPLRIRNSILNDLPLRLDSNSSEITSTDYGYRTPCNQSIYSIVIALKYVHLFLEIARKKNFTVFREEPIFQLRKPLRHLTLDSSVNVATCPKLIKVLASWRHGAVKSRSFQSVKESFSSSRVENQTSKRNRMHKSPLRTNPLIGRLRSYRAISINRRPSYGSVRINNRQSIRSSHSESSKVLMSNQLLNIVEKLRAKYSGDFRGDLILKPIVRIGDKIRAMQARVTTVIMHGAPYSVIKQCHLGVVVASVLRDKIKDLLEEFHDCYLTNCKDNQTSPSDVVIQREDTATMRVVCHVTVVESMNQGVICASQCLQESNTDKFYSFSYKFNDAYTIVTIYLIREFVTFPNFIHTTNLALEQAYTEWMHG